MLGKSVGIGGARRRTTGGGDVGDGASLPLDVGLGGGGACRLTAGYAGSRRSKTVEIGKWRVAGQLVVSRRSNAFTSLAVPPFLSALTQPFRQTLVAFFSVLFVGEFFGVSSSIRTERRKRHDHYVDCGRLELAGFSATTVK
jgi:hypothetical protein